MVFRRNMGLRTRRERGERAHRSARESVLYVRSEDVGRFGRSQLDNSPNECNDADQALHGCGCLRKPLRTKEAGFIFFETFRTMSDVIPNFSKTVLGVISIKHSLFQDDPQKKQLFWRAVRHDVFDQGASFPRHPSKGLRLWGRHASAIMQSWTILWE